MAGLSLREYRREGDAREPFKDSGQERARRTVTPSEQVAPDLKRPASGPPVTGHLSPWRLAPILNAGWEVARQRGSHVRRSTLNVVSR